MSRIPVLLLVLGTAGALACPAAATAQLIVKQSGLRKVTVDAAASSGTLRSLQGVDGAPGPGGHKPEYFKFGGWNMHDGVDASVGYRLANIDLVRTHDSYGPLDIDSKFETAEAPGGALIHADRDVLTLFPDIAADPDDPASYRFGPSDRLIASIKNVGAQVLFRVGRSEGSDPTPPPDFGRYAAIVKHIVLHYNAGWAHGFHYGIRYWEFWNEPDLGKLFWSGTEEQYFDLYSKVARAIKQADPNALVGGPAIAKPNDATPYRDKLMQQTRTGGVPFDFYSWHWYATDSNDPRDFLRIAQDLRTRLDKYGHRHALSLLTEWNYGLSDPPPSPLVRAAFVASAVIYMEDAPIDAATLYRADNVFGPDGATPDKTGQALIALGRMKATPVRLATIGGDTKGFAVEAGRSADGHLIRILVSNYQIPQQLIGPRQGDNVLHVGKEFDVGLLTRRDVHYEENGGFDLTLTHLPTNHSYLVERCRITAHDDLTRTAAVVPAGQLVELKEVLPPPGVELISVRRLEGGNLPKPGQQPELRGPSRCDAP